MEPLECISWGFLWWWKEKRHRIRSPETCGSSSTTGVIGWSAPVPWAPSAAQTGWPPASWSTPASPAGSWSHFAPPPRHCSPGTWHASVGTNPGCAPGGPSSKPLNDFLRDFFLSSQLRWTQDLCHVSSPIIYPLRDQHFNLTRSLKKHPHSLNISNLPCKETMKMRSEWSASDITFKRTKSNASWEFGSQKNPECQWKSAANAESIWILHIFLK